MDIKQQLVKHKILFATVASIRSVTVGGVAVAASGGNVAMTYNSEYDQWYANYVNFTSFSTLADVSPVHGYQKGDYVGTDIGGDFNTATPDEYFAEVSYNTHYLQSSSYGTYAGGSNAPTEFILQYNYPASSLDTIRAIWGNKYQNVYPNHVDWQPSWTWVPTGAATYYWDQTPLASGEWAAFGIYNPDTGQPTFASALYGPSSHPIYLTTDSAPHSQQGIAHRNRQATSNGSVPTIIENSKGRVVGRYTTHYVETHHHQLEQKFHMHF